GERATFNVPGDITMIGNTLMTGQASGMGSTSAANLALVQQGILPAGQDTSLLNNNSWSMGYVNTNIGQTGPGGATIFNSSQATLNLPEGATVLFAGLYWMGNAGTANSPDTSAPNPALRNEVFFETPGTTSFGTVVGQVLGEQTSTSGMGATQTTNINYA